MNSGTSEALKFPRAEESPVNTEYGDGDGGPPNEWEALAQGYWRAIELIIERGPFFEAAVFRALKEAFGKDE